MYDCRRARAAAPAALTALGLLALVAWAVYARSAQLFASPYPLGVDGYYYPLQLRALAEGGALRYPSAPLTLYFMAPLAALTDTITGAKLGAALAGGLVAVPMYLLGRRVGGSRSAGMLAALLAATSAESFYLGTEFVKQSVGITVALSYLCVLLWALDAPARRWPWPVALLAVCAASHKLALVLALALSVGPLVVWYRAARPRLSRVIAGGLGLVAALVLAGLVAPARFPSGADLEVCTGLFSGAWNPGLPVLQVPGNPPLRLQYEVPIAMALAVLVLALRLARRRCPDWPGIDRAGRATRAAGARPVDGLVMGAVALAVLAGWPTLAVADPQGLGFRLRLVCFVPLAVCAAALAGDVLGRVSALRRTMLLVPFAVAFAVARPTGAWDGVVQVHPAMQTAMRAVARTVPVDAVVIVPERHLMYMAAWYARRDTRLRPEPVAPERRWRLLPGAYIDRALADALDRVRDDPASAGDVRGFRDLHPVARDGLVLVSEAQWQRVLSRLAPSARERYLRWPTL